MTNPQNSRYKELLDELQLQSWQLELVISGFAIFGLFSALEPLFDWFTLNKLKENQFLKWISYSLYFSCILTLVNLIIHVILRGLWIGAVGIRSVSGEIDFEKLNFSRDFDKYLKKRIGSFDSFIERIETYSSIMFGISFMVVFMTIGFFIGFCIFMFTISLLFDPTHPNLGIRMISFFLLTCVFTIIYLITFLDFITGGIFKKEGGKFLLIVYRISSILTLSIFYRPLLYNLWDNKFGKKLMKWLIPIYIVGILIFSTTYVSTHYFSTDFDNDLEFAYRMKYWDMLEEKGDHIGYAAIPSKTITTPFLDVSIDYERYLEEMIYEYDENLRPKKSRIGYKSLFYTLFRWDFGTSPNFKQEKELLKTINKIFITKIDHILINEHFEVVQEKSKSIYLKKYIDISNLKNGKHLLTIQRRTSKTDSTKLEHYETIPFWYFKD